MAPERIFQGRQRGILGLVGGKDTCNPHLTRSAPEPYNLNPKRRLLPSFAPLSPTHDPKHWTPLSPEAAPSPSPRGPARLLEPPTQAHCGWPSERNCPRPPSRLPGKGTLHPEDAYSAGLPLPEKSGLSRGSGFGWTQLSRPDLSPKRRAAFLTAAAPGCLAQSDPTTRPGSVRLSSARRRRCALGGGGDALAARAPARSPRVSPRRRRLLCLECESFRFPLGIKANHK